MGSALQAKISQDDSILDYIVIEESIEFVGPAIDSNKNYGLYIGNDLEIVVFYFKDIARKVKINYYHLRPFPSSHMNLE